jgi:hypothetical protein
VIGLEYSPRHAELVKRTFGEDQELVPPGVLIEIDPLEFGVLKQVFRYSNDQSVAATVGQRQQIGLRNPAKSGILVVVEDSMVINLTGAVRTFIWRIEDPSAVGSSSNIGSSVDGRQNKGPTAQLMTLSQVGAVGNIIWTARVATDALYEWKDGIVLTPGRVMWVEAGVDNVQLNGTVRWRERPARPEELTLA